MQNFPDPGPELTFPEAETRCLKQCYSDANVILEYGSGGSTVLASKMSNKLVFSVESDYWWAVDLQSYIDRLETLSLTTVFHADIGPTGRWGRALDASYWTQFHTYPLAIWEQPYFRHPDVVLIDGRFRAACMLAVMARVKRTVKVLFDDYVDRIPYHVVEDFARPSKIVGRMAIFDIEPGLVKMDDLSAILSSISQATYDNQNAFYKASAPVAIENRTKRLAGETSKVMKEEK